MPKFDLECQYCGHRWQAVFWNMDSLRSTTCINGKCNDKNLKAKKLEDDGNNDIFGYNYKPKANKPNQY